MVTLVLDEEEVEEDEEDEEEDEEDEEEDELEDDVLVVTPNIVKVKY